MLAGEALAQQGGAQLELTSCANDEWQGGPIPAPVTKAPVAPSMAPSVAPTPPLASGAFIVNQGPCTLSSGGACVSSPNYPLLYNNSQTCKIKAVVTGYAIGQYPFLTEANTDILR